MHRALITIGSVLTLALLIAACGGGDDTKESKGAQQATPQATGAAGQAAATQAP